MPALLVVLAVAAVAIVLGLYMRSLPAVLTEFFAPIRDGLTATAGSLEETGRRLGVRTAVEMRRLGLRRAHGALVVGALLFTAFFLVIAPLEYVQFAMLANGLGLGDATTPEWLEWINPAQLTGGSALIIAIAAGVTLRELFSGTGRLLPIARMGKAERIITGSIAGACLIAIGYVVYAGGPFRVEAIVGGSDLEAAQLPDSMLTASSPEDSALAALYTPIHALPTATAAEANAAMATLVVLPLALTFMALETFHFGPEFLLAVLPAGMLRMMQGVVLATARALLAARWLVLVVWGVLMAALQWWTRVGITISRFMVTWTREVHQRASQRDTDDSATRRLVRALTAWSLDVELPDQPIGNAQRLQDAVNTNQAGAEATTGPPPTGPETNGRPEQPGTPPAELEMPQLDLETETQSPSRDWAPFSR